MKKLIIVVTSKDKSRHSTIVLPEVGTFSTFWNESFQGPVMISGWVEDDKAPTIGTEEAVKGPSFPLGGPAGAQRFA